MNKLDVEAFILSQRAKLLEEKSRLENNDRKMKGILPSDSITLERRGKLRRERQSEYQDYISKRKIELHPGGNSAPIEKSIEDIRRNISDERNKEISQNQAEIKVMRQSSPRGNDDYALLKDRKIAEERRYRGEVVCSQPNPSCRRKQLGNDSRQDQYARVRFENESNKKEIGVDDGGDGGGGDRYHSSWDKEEKDLLQWTHNQAHYPSNDSKRQSKRPQTPPTYDYPHKTDSHAAANLRSISAPSVTGFGLIGREESTHTKRMRQMKYANELRNQIREKQDTKQREGATRIQSEMIHDSIGMRGHRDDGRDRNIPTHHCSDGRDRNIPTHHCSSDVPPAAARDRNIPTHHCSSDVPPAAACHPRDENRVQNRQCGSREEDNEEERNGQHPHARYHDYYHHDSYPPPPPRFGGYGPLHGDPWRPPYHPHTRYEERFEDDPYAQRYNPYYRDSRYGDPPANGSRPLRRYDGDTNYSKPPRNYNGREEYRYDRSPPPLQQSKGEPKLSPLQGMGSGVESKPDKTTYRNQLEIQMREKKEREMKERLAKAKYEGKMETEVYDPFGKGGCGAPVRDQHGNLVADLKKMRHINENRLSNTSPRVTDNPSGGESQSPTTNNILETKLTYDKFDGLDVKKATQNSYRDYLKQQVKEKEAMKLEEKERQKIEERKELEQLERDRKRMKEEYQMELERQRKKEEDARNKNRTIKKQAEIKRQMEIMKLEEAEQHRKFDDPLDNTSWKNRSDSPPIPTLRNKKKQLGRSSTPSPPSEYPVFQDHTNQRSFAPSSPPVPALRKKRQTAQVQNNSHNDGANVSSHQNAPPTDESGGRPGILPQDSDQNKLLTQLGAIRMHLQQELAKQTHKSDIFQQQRPKIVVTKITRPRVNTVNALDELKYNTDSTQRQELELQQGSQINMLEKAQKVEGQRRLWEECPQSPDRDMAAKNEERLKRLEVILNAGSSSTQPQIEIGVGGTLGDGSSKIIDIKRPTNHLSVRTVMPNRGLLSRQSEKSMECETQHLPAS